MRDQAIKPVIDTDGFHFVFSDGYFDAMSTSPLDGLAVEVGSVSMGEGGIPLYGEPGSVRIRRMDSGRTSVMAVSSADLSSSALRPGIPGSGGKVSVILLLGTDCPDSAMSRAAVTASEAVTCVIQDLGLRDSEGSPASCPERLSITVVRDRSSDLYLRSAGKHSRLGELIGRCVYRAVADAASANGAGRISDRAIVRRLEEAGIDIPERCEDDGILLAATSSALFLRDEAEWGIIPGENARKAVRAILERTCDRVLVSEEIDDMISEALRT